MNGLLAASVTAQQTVPFRNNMPMAPQGIPPVPLPTAPVTFDTAEGQKIKVAGGRVSVVSPSVNFCPSVATNEPLLEYACHEGNVGLAGILSGARKQEAEQASGR